MVKSGYQQPQKVVAMSYNLSIWNSGHPRFWEQYPIRQYPVPEERHPVFIRFSAHPLSLYLLYSICARRREVCLYATRANIEKQSHEKISFGYLHLLLGLKKSGSSLVKEK